MKNVYFYETEIGTIGIADNGEAITDLYFGNEMDAHMSICETELIKKAWAQLSEYFSGKRRAFDLPLCFEGTEFQKKVWSALCEIPYGETRSYKQVAEAAGSPKACRAVGMANNRNKISIIAPCHRVIGADGSMVGYGGGLHIKEKLLQLEKENLSGTK